MSKTDVVVLGASAVADVPGLESLADVANFRFAKGAQALQAALPGAQVLLGWDFRAGEVEQAWAQADKLRWIQWGGAGVDSLLFPELASSEVVVSNAGGLFDRPMAEYVLGAMLFHAKRFRETLRFQAKAEWNYRLNTRIFGQSALVIGVGSIGKDIARLLQAVGLNVVGVGRTSRDGEPVFGHVHGFDERLDLLPDADYVILITPLTEQTRDFFGGPELAAMRESGYLINVGRGELLDEQALLRALQNKQIAGAMLDVFREEPLPSASNWWQREDVLVSPHCSGDFHGFNRLVAELFMDNFHRFRRGEPLLSVVDKKLGFVPSNSA
jgi:phosphoglycerate dehydrogenase-like enzyme